jgi:enoyl-CoA hydratase/carnithine racemase
VPSREAIQAVMLRGGNRSAYTAGWDRELAKQLGSKKAASMLRRYYQLVYMLATMKKPTIACLSGEVSLQLKDVRHGGKA